MAGATRQAGKVPWRRRRCLFPLFEQLFCIELPLAWIEASAAAFHKCAIFAASVPGLALSDRKSSPLSVGLLFFSTGKSFAGAPLQYLTSSGAKADPVVALTWGVIAISLIVITVIAVLLILAIWRRRPPGAAGAKADLVGLGDGRNWLWIGVGTSSLALLFTVIWTMVVLAKILVPPSSTAVTIEVTGKQWWWKVRYISDGAIPAFVTANEIHIPTGQPVRLRLIGGDVIHSFWVPQLAGKMDAIPGQINQTWIEADRPGIYTGQCTEYCGVQHSKMLILVIAQSPADFSLWRIHQLAPPADRSGAREFTEHCGNCHTVRGTDAKGSFGPDLSHLMERRTLASASLPNDQATLARWIADPQKLKPGNLMPSVRLSAEQQARIVNWLRGLN